MIDDPKKRREGKHPLPEWLVKKLDIPAELCEGEMRVEMRGRSSLLVHGCRRILDYSPELLRLGMKECVMCIKGENLLCQAYLAGAVGIEGKIFELRFEEASC